MDKEFPSEISFYDELDQMQTQRVEYECKPIICSDCNGIGHTMEECRKKHFDVANRKIKQSKQQVPKAR